MIAVELVGLSRLMELTSGRRDILVGLLDGPVAADHPALAGDSIRMLSRDVGARRAEADSVACQHGTFVAGILVARRGGSAPAICPGCSLLVRPIFAGTAPEGRQLPSATPRQVSSAIDECVDAGARVLNLSAAMTEPSTRDEPLLRDSLDHALRQGAVVVAAAGNQATLGGSAITRHPWVIPVVGYGVDRLPSAHSNLGTSIGRRGVGAPGESVTSLSPHGGSVTLTGTSFAAPFVTGTIALLWSLFPSATAAQVTRAVTGGVGRRRTSVVPPLLDAWGAYQLLSTTQPEG